MDIPAVIVYASGGNWDGFAASGSQRGWDIGLYSAADHPNQVATSANNYLCRSSVDLIGTIVEEMKLAGAYVEVNEDKDNIGCGIYSIAVETRRGLLPFGGFLGLDHCGIHLNREHGLHLLAAPGGMPTISRNFVGAIVGGTWDQALGSSLFSFIPDPSKPSDPNIAKQGQGHLNGCAISGSSKSGLKVTMLGNAALTYGQPHSDYAAASLRVVNSYIWGSEDSGFEVDVGSLAPGPDPALLTSLVHSTLEDNTDHSVDLVYTPVPGTGSAFYVEEPDGSMRYLNTSLTNCILQRSNPQDLDFNSTFGGGSPSQNRWRFDIGVGNTFRDREHAYIAGLRAKFQSSWGPLNEGDAFWLDAATPFQGSPSGLDPAQWFLVNQGADPRFVHSNNYLNGGFQTVTRVEKRTDDGRHRCTAFSRVAIRALAELARQPLGGAGSARAGSRSCRQPETLG